MQKKRNFNSNYELKHRHCFICSCFVAVVAGSHFWYLFHFGLSFDSSAELFETFKFS